MISQVGSLPWRLISPWIERAFAPAPRGALPSPFGRQAKSLPRPFTQPLAVRRRVVPGDADNRLLGIRKHRIGPKGWSLDVGLIDKNFVLSVDDRKFSDGEAIE